MSCSTNTGRPTAIDRPGSAPEPAGVWWACIPAWNAEATLPPLIYGIQEQGLCVLVVDDGSADRTVQVARASGSTVLAHPENRGKGAALATAFAWIHQHPAARGVVTLDADGQHDPRDIPSLLAPLEAGTSCVTVGVRDLRHPSMPRIRRWTNRAMTCLLQIFLRQPVPDSQCGFRAYRKEVLGPLLKTSDTRYAAESEHLLRLDRAGVRICPVRVRTIYNGSTSAIRPFRDGFRFFRVLSQALRRDCSDAPAGGV